MIREKGCPVSLVSPARTDDPWAAARAALEGLPDGGLNMAWEAADRHARERPRAIAVRWTAPDGRAGCVTYGALAERAARFAGALEALGIAPGTSVFGLLERGPAQVTAILGSLRAGAVYAPLFPEFGPEPLQTRLAGGRAAAVVTSVALWKRRLSKVIDGLDPRPEVLVADADGDPPAGTHDLRALMDAAEPCTLPVATGPESPAFLQFTSGTTGQPKGALHVHEALVAQHETARSVLGLTPDDVFWCTADPGWVTGLVYGVLAPLSVGCTVVVDTGDFDARRWLHLLGEERVTVWYTTPTAVRLLRRAGVDFVRGHGFPHLRRMFSVGEPLDATAVRFGEEAFGLPFRDTWWQTETGAIMIANAAGDMVTPGAMGRPVPGIHAAIAHKRDDGGLDFVHAPDTVGDLVLWPDWPSRFRGYLDAPERTTRCFADGWYITGDLARRDAEGRFWFVGRADDVIKASGHLVSPFEVESALLAHPAVAEAAATGRPDPVAGQLVIAHVALNPDYAPTDEQRRALLAHARKRLGAALAPREILFRDAMPKTRSGKIQRRVLQAEDPGSAAETPATQG